MRILPFAVVTVALPLAGCFMSDTSLYEGVASVQPLGSGKMISRDSDGKVGHLTLDRNLDGSYAFLNSDPGKDFGTGALVRFFPLPGASSDTLIFDGLMVCKPHDKECKPGTPHFYGLWRETPQGAEEVVPDCPKKGPIAKLRGVKADNYGSCDFSNRVALEKALLIIAKQKPKADMVYKFE
jgi:hypothetical protein